MISVFADIAILIIAGVIAAKKSATNALLLSISTLPSTFLNLETITVSYTASNVNKAQT